MSGAERLHCTENVVTECVRALCRRVRECALGDMSRQLLIAMEFAHTLECHDSVADRLWNELASMWPEQVKRLPGGIDGPTALQKFMRELSNLNDLQTILNQVAASRIHHLSTDENARTKLYSAVGHVAVDFALLIDYEPAIRFITSTFTKPVSFAPRAWLRVHESVGRRNRARACAIHTAHNV